MTENHDLTERSNEQEALGEPEVAPQIPQSRHSLLTMRLTWRGILVVLAAIVVVRLFLIESAIVDGRSMTNTLLPGEWVLVLKPLSPHRFSVVTFNDGEGGVTIKRVVGLPGDTIGIVPKRASSTFSGAQVVLNGAPLVEPYAVSATPEILPPTQVPDRSYFVLGDNRDDSDDSRQFGPIEQRAVRGRAVAVIYPLSRIRAIPDRAEPAPVATASLGAGASAH